MLIVDAVIKVQFYIYLRNYKVLYHKLRLSFVVKIRETLVKTLPPPFAPIG